MVSGILVVYRSLVIKTHISNIMQKCTIEKHPFASHPKPTSMVHAMVNCLRIPLVWSLNFLIKILAKHATVVILVYRYCMLKSYLGGE